MYKHVLGSAKAETREQDPELEKTKDYEVFDLNKDMGSGEFWIGQPYMTDIFENVEYGDSALIYVNNHENQEKLRGRVKIKGITEKREVSFWQGSLGFDLVKSIKELAGETFDESVNVFTINFDELREYINSLDELKVKVIDHTANINGDVSNWNTLRVMDLHYSDD